MKPSLAYWVDPAEEKRDKELAPLLEAYHSADEDKRQALLGSYQKSIPPELWERLADKVAAEEAYLDTPLYTPRQFLEVQNLVADVADEVRRMSDAQLAEWRTKVDELQAALVAETQRRDDLARLQATAAETRQGVAAIAQKLHVGEKPAVIAWGEAVVIMKKIADGKRWADGSDGGGEVTERTIRNWLKAGKAAKTGTPISWNDLSSVAAWSVWVEVFLAALKSRVTCRKLVSERAGKVERERQRKKSPTRLRDDGESGNE